MQPAPADATTATITDSQFVLNLCGEGHFQRGAAEGVSYGLFATVGQTLRHYALRIQRSAAIASTNGAAIPMLLHS